MRITFNREQTLTKIFLNVGLKLFLLSDECFINNKLILKTFQLNFVNFCQNLLAGTRRF